MRAIVSVTQDWGIGYRGGLAMRNREDMRRFRELTLGGAVICGARTLEGFPGGRPLPGRLNVVLSHDGSLLIDGAVVAHGVDEALAAMEGIDPGCVWLIGGGSVYRAMLGLCDEALVTFHHASPPVDTLFPDLDADPGWRLVEVQDGGVTQDGVRYEYRTYRQRG